MELSICIPCYNAESYIPRCYKALTKTLSPSIDYELIFSQDGSTDRTEELLLQIARKDKRVIVISYPKRRGKGFGFKNCIKLASGEYLILYDVDCPVDVKYILRIVELAKAVNSDVVLCKRKFLNYPFIRRLASRVYLLLTKLLFHHPFRDLQAGFKLIKRDILDGMELKCEGFVIDTEIVIKAMKKGAKISEMEVPWVYGKKSTITRSFIRVSLQMLKDLLKLWKEIALRE